MELTKEQYDIINSTGNIKINAVAGSGKTTTIIEYAKARPGNSKILYLAFNKSVKLEAIKRFAINGLDNVKVETAHSLAYKHIVLQYGYKVRPNGYKTNEIAELLNLQGDAEKHTKYIVANHINKFIAYFCNSNKQKVQDLNYLDVVSDSKAKIFVTAFYKYIENQTRLLLSKMNKGEIEITHDFYLKKFQLSVPNLNFDYILFDEAQDASSAMLDIFLKQKATKVIVGDTHQQIYSWRFAVNSLEKADFNTFYLSTSFRFSQSIANLAMNVLGWKKQISEYKPIPITGTGKGKVLKTKAILARTNLGLLLKAIEHVTENKKLKRIYFEGNINSYTYAEDGASLYDVLSLYNGKHHLIKDNMLKAMKDLGELEDYIDKTEDVQLGMMVKIVKRYGNDIHNIIRSIKDKHVENEDKEKAEIIFSTVHRCKGMEYDEVHLVDDFITEEKLEKLLEDKKKNEVNTAKLNEEINLVYVAVTRTKNSLHIPEILMPAGFPVSAQIHVILLVNQTGKPQAKIIGMQPSPPQKIVKPGTQNGKAYSLEAAKEKNKTTHRPWTDELDKELTVMFCEGVSMRDMIIKLERTKRTIISRIKKLELEELYG